MIEGILEGVRKETEKCESLQGFQLFHGIAGGTGGGLGSLLTEQLHEIYPGLSLHNFPVLYYRPLSDTDAIVSPYNAILTLNKLIENSSAVFVLITKHLLTFG